MYDVAAIAVEHPNPVPTRAFAYFLLVTFGISWVLIGVYVLAPEWATLFAGWSFLPFFVGNITLAILAQPYDTWLLVMVAVGVVWWNRDAMFTRGSAVTRVIPGERS